MTTQDSEIRRPVEEPGQPPTFPEAVGKFVSSLYRELRGENSALSSRARATLSRLRRSAGRQGSQDPLAWSEVLDRVLASGGEQWLGRGDAPSLYEQAAFTSLSFYAIHQGSHAENMHRPGQGLGSAVGSLAKARESKSIKPRFDALMAAKTVGSTQYHLRSLITLLGSEGIPVDYGRLAQDLVTLRRKEYRDGVLLRWSRDFARAVNPPAKTPQTTQNP